MRFIVLVAMFSITACSTQLSFEHADQLLDARDIKGAIAIYTPLAESGDIRAQSRLWDIYQRAAVRDREKVAIYAKKAADQGDVEAQFYMGAFHLGGVGVPQNAELAEAYFKQAADAGDTRAMLTLAKLYVQRCKTDPDTWKPKAVAMFRAGFEHGDANSAGELASFLRSESSNSRYRLIVAEAWGFAFDDALNSTGFDLGGKYKERSSYMSNEEWDRADALANSYMSQFAIKKPAKGYLSLHPTPYHNPE